ncbi:MAG: Gfo/Idh/MocA family oxidoreductase [Bryobacteraceae bacterium]|nr:Gfo/Idh/MocA family oxidoreductase [Bryobacteraceae bacterium]
MRKLRAAIFGTGFMGKVHAEAIRRLGGVEVAAVAASTEDKAVAFAEANWIPRSTSDWKSLCADPAIDAVHICTPNALHYPMAAAAIDGGKHVLLEKPLTMDAAEAEALLRQAEAKGVAHCVNHNLRAYPVVQQARAMIAAGELGEILIAQGTYYQDWLLYDTDYNWRVEEADNGPLRAMGDIGSHWMDLVQHLTGLPITAVNAALATFHQTRKRPRGPVETFTGKRLNPDQYEPVAIRTDDFGAVLFEMGELARGVFSVSQVSAGRKNRFAFEIYGTRAGAAWSQERPDELWIGRRNEPNQVLIKDGSLMLAPAAAYADLPGGHSEGYDDTHKQTFRRFYARIADAAAPVDYPTFADGLRGMRLLAAVAKSSSTRQWEFVP